MGGKNTNFSGENPFWGPFNGIFTERVLYNVSTKIDFKLASKCQCWSLLIIKEEGKFTSERASSHSKIFLFFSEFFYAAMQPNLHIALF